MAAASAAIHHQVENDQPNSVFSVPATTCPKIRNSAGATNGSTNAYPHATRKPTAGWIPRAVYV